MPSYPATAKIQVAADRTVKVSTGRPRPYYSRGDTVDLAPGEVAVEVEFNTPLKDANWVFAGLTFWNSQDADVDIVFIAAVSRVLKSASGFTLLLSAPPPSDGHKLDWAIAERYNP